MIEKLFSTAALRYLLNWPSRREYSLHLRMPWHIASLNASDKPSTSHSASAARSQGDPTTSLPGREKNSRVSRKANLAYEPVKSTVIFEVDYHCVGGQELAIGRMIKKCN